MTKSKLTGIFLILLISISGCSSTSKFETNDINKAQVSTGNQGTIKITGEKVEKEMKFRTTDIKDKGISGVTLMILGYDGNVIDTIITDKNGEFKKVIKVDQDKRYPDAGNVGYSPRGTVTVIAFKDGYRESVLFEAAVSEGATVQNIIMYPLIKGERNEPMVELGNNHHLEILSLVEKYAKIIGKESHY